MKLYQTHDGDKLYFMSVFNVYKIVPFNSWIGVFIEVYGPRFRVSHKERLSTLVMRVAY